jgi:hypothetical protein
MMGPVLVKKTPVLVPVCSTWEVEVEVCTKTELRWM